MKTIKLFLVVLVLAGCAKQAQALPPPVTAAPPTATAPPTQPPTETPTARPTADPTLFGAIGTGEIQAFALESVANAIFKKVVNGFVADGSVRGYQITGSIVLRGDTNLLAEIKYNVQSSDTAWLTDGGAPAADGWINGNCSRFDLIITDTEYQLKNRRACG